MLYYLHLLQDIFSPLRIFRYLTFRAVAAAGTAFLISVWVGPWVIERLRRLQMRQVIRKDEAPPLYLLHARKEGTPTMGGILIIGSILISCIVWADPANLYLWLALTTLCFTGFIGFLDDFLKVSKKNVKGLLPRYKLLMQAAWTLLLLAILLSIPETGERTRQLMVPFLKDPVIRDMGVIGTFLFMYCIISGASNAVNLTDGLDGLAIGCSGSVAFAYLVMAYAAGHYGFAEYLRVPFIKNGGELAVFCGALLGACLWFLWWNCHPASVFMGDTGSLALGGAIAIVAILIKQELVLLIVGGVFVMEALSVILQVLFFKLRGRRIFAMAPIHHHFEMHRWSETQVTIRFWILSIILALFGVLALKIR